MKLNGPKKTNPQNKIKNNKKMSTTKQPTEKIACEPALESIPLKVKKLSHFKGALPTYHSLRASGFDIRAQLCSSIQLKPLQRELVPTGLIFEIPPGYEIQIRPRSGLSFKQGLSIPNSPGTIDADFRGELKVIVINLSDKDIYIEDQQRVAQAVLCPVAHANLSWAKALSTTSRDSGGFGSTGI